MKGTRAKTDCYLNIVKAKKALANYMKRFDDCTFQTQQAYLMDILNFLSFMQQNYQHIDGHLLLSKSRAMDWMKAIAFNRSIERFVQIILTVAHFTETLVIMRVTCADPFADIKAQFGKHGWRGIAYALQSSDPKSSLEAVQTEPRFSGCFGQHAQTFIDLHRAAGEKYRTNEYTLIEFNRLLRERSVDSLTSVTTDIVQDWLGSMTCGAGRRRAKLFALRRFFFHLNRLGVVQSNPVTDDVVNSAGKPDRSFKPYIFSKDQISALLDLTKKLPPTITFPLRPKAVYTIIGLMYTLGLRTGEALSLKLKDIDMNNNTLFIQQTKFYKERLIPFGPRLGRCLEDYLELRRTACPSEHVVDCVFINRRQEPISATCIRDTFKTLLDEIGIARPAKKRGPRLYDLRHTFAVHRLLQWYHEGVDVQKQLVLLSTFMGHFNIYSTQVYLTITGSLLNEANKRFHKNFGIVFDKEQEL
jgi:site-specific recombinase XerD